MPQNQRFLTLLENCLIVFHGIILILVIGQQYIALPAFLEVLGRTHPLLLHFPIVLVFLTGLLFWYPNWLGISSEGLLRLLFPVCLNLTGLTVLAGLFLSAEGGYVQEDLNAHQWTGLGVFWVGTLWYIFWSKGKVAAAKLSSLFALALVLVAGHLGANITHGSDFLLAPLAKYQEKPSVPIEEALAFDHVIKPILEQKCISCHGPNKKKGELRLDERQFFLAGGETGPVLDDKEWENSLLLQRLFLPLEDEEHMPPKGKSQLTEKEIQLLQAWVLDSAHFDRKVSHYENEGTFFTLAKGLFDSNTKKTYTFPFADNSSIAKLNNEYRVIKAIYPDSPGLRVSFFGKNQFDAKSLDELAKIKEQVVELNLQNMPLNDADMGKLSVFPNLEILNLNFTGITGTGLDRLITLTNLRQLSLSGNPLSGESLSHLANFRNLQNLFIWNTKLTPNQTAELVASMPRTHIESGFQDDGTVYQLNPPVIQSDKSIFRDGLQITMKHPIGSAKIFYTLDGTEPDSSNYFLYEGPILLESNTTVRARAFAAGWKGSVEKSGVFLKSGIKPQVLNLGTLPSDRYKGKGAETLFDMEKGDIDFSSGNWLGYQDKPLEITMEFGEEKSVRSLAFSLLSAEGSYIFPPAKIEIWVSNPAGDWQLVQAAQPKQPDKIRESLLFLEEYPIDKGPVKAIRAKLTPVNPLPKWHPGAGQKGWIFIDEILIN